MNRFQKTEKIQILKTSHFQTFCKYDVLNSV